VITYSWQWWYSLFAGCIHVVIFYDGLMYWCMSAHICWGIDDACKSHAWICSLKFYIPTYLDVIIMFCIDLWKFSIDPLILIITLQNRKTLVCIFWHFRDLSELIFLHKKQPGMKNHERGPQGPNETRWCGHLAGPRHLGPFGPRTFDDVRLHSRSLSLT
jgi:hypothetical protein